MSLARLGKSITIVAGCAVIGSLGGCTSFRPLYADVTASGMTVAGTESGVGRSLSQIDVEVLTTREGVQLRNDLLYALRGRGDLPDNANYRLTLSLSKSSSNVAIAAVSGLSTAANLTMTASYTLLRNGGNSEALYTGRAVARASFDKGVQRFANIRAERDAEDRAARDLADQIRNGLAAYFARQPAS
jgi:LPS-assembly lipoprotein